ncbi:MAG TPA: hypothetical protein VFQ54_02140, partial [Thermomicrobiales bacterium]|nr:hypothetical protein [Thermomicrobiales bacterium]
MENPRVDAVTKERMRVWITEAETELVSRFGEGIGHSLVDAVRSGWKSAKTEPALWEMKAGIREPETVADQNRYQWSAWS